MPTADEQLSDAAGSFLHERPRLLRVAARILGDPDEAQDIVQQAWIRWDRAPEAPRDPAAWLTTVTTRLCLDRLRGRTAVPVEEVVVEGSVPDPADAVALADTVSAALHVVLDRLTPAERVAFVLHDTFAVDFATIAQVLDSSPAAARKLASRARAKVSPAAVSCAPADAAVVDAFLDAAKGGDLARLLELLAPDAVVSADTAAVAMGTPDRLEGRESVARMFNGAAQTAFPVHIDGRPGAAWLHRGEFKVAFDFTVADGRVRRIRFRADPALLAALRRR